MFFWPALRITSKGYPACKSKMFYTRTSEKGGCLKKASDFIWYGERGRRLDAYRPCPCGTCSGTHQGVGYLSSSDASGHGFTVWIQNEEVFQRLSEALKRRVTKNRYGIKTPSNHRAP